MTREMVIQKIIDELSINGICLILNPHIFGEYMEMIYTVGYDEGRRMHSNQKQIIQMNYKGEILMEYPSAHEASRRTWTDVTGIVNVCKGKQHTAGGYLWKYKTETNEKLSNPIAANPYNGISPSNGG